MAMMKPLSRTLLGLSALGAVSLVRGAIIPPGQPAAGAPEAGGSSQVANPVRSAGAIVHEAIGIIGGEVETASAATPCDPRDYTPGREAYCIPIATPTPKPSATAKPAATPAPKPASTPKIATPAPTAVGSRAAPGKPIFQTSSTNIQTGSTVTLSWSSSGAASCTLSPGQSFSGNSGSYTSPALTSNTTYSLSCKNSYGTVNAGPISIKVSAAAANIASGPATIVSFFADPAHIASGQTSTLYWTGSGIPAGSCSVSPGTLSRANAIGSWATPYLLGSKTYTLTCRGSANEVVYASATVIVDGIVANDSAPADDPANQPKSFGSDLGTVINAMALEQVSGLVTLEPSLFTDSAKASLVAKVEFYEDTKKLDTLTVQPYAFDTRKLKDGPHALRQVTYYRDNTVDSVTRIVTVKNAVAAQATTSTGGPIVVVLGLIVLACAVAGGVWFWLRRRTSALGLASDWQRPGAAPVTPPANNSATQGPDIR